MKTHLMTAELFTFRIFFLFFCFLYLHLKKNLPRHFLLSACVSVFVDVGCRPVLIRDHKLLRDCTMSHGRKWFGQNAQCCISEYHTMVIKDISICMLFHVSRLHRLNMLLLSLTDKQIQTNSVPLTVLTWVLSLFSRGPIWWFIICPVSWTSLFLFLYVQAMTVFTHPSEHNHLYLTLLFRLTGAKGSSSPSLPHAFPAMKKILLYIAVLSVTNVVCGQSFDRSSIRGRWFHFHPLSKQVDFFKWLFGMSFAVFPAENQTVAGVFLVSVLDQPRYAFNASEARRMCGSLGVTIASKAQVREALDKGLETCR